MIKISIDKKTDNDVSCETSINQDPREAMKQFMKPSWLFKPGFQKTLFGCLIWAILSIIVGSAVIIKWIINVFI